MIQDIAPHVFYNHYKNTKPSKGDCILSFVGKTVAITDFSNTPVRYLFSIDDTKYFLSMEEINAEQKTAYVIKSENLSNYDLNLFKAKRFDNYCVVMPAQYAEW